MIIVSEINQDKTERNNGITNRLRFFASIGLMILGPALGRFLIAVCGLPFLVIPVMIGVMGLCTLSWMISDIRQKKFAFPRAVFLSIIVITFIVGLNSHSVWWQGFAGWFAAYLF